MFGLNSEFGVFYLISLAFVSTLMYLLHCIINSYRVLVTSDNSGLIETIQNSISIHSIKKDAYAKKLNEKGFMFTLFDYFVKV